MVSVPMRTAVSPVFYSLRSVSAALDTKVFLLTLCATWHQSKLLPVIEQLPIRALGCFIVRSFDAAQSPLHVHYPRGCLSARAF
eukprot:4789283-Amphidinium_carterae.1